MADLSQQLTDEFFASWLTALDRTVNETGIARIACIGDSTTEGVGAGALADTWPQKLQVLLTNAGFTARDGAIFGDSTWYTDPRISTGSGWSGWQSASWGPGSDGHAWQATTSASGNLSFTFPDPIDTIRVYYAKTGSSGSSSIEVDGGSTLGSINTTGSAGTGYVDFSCAAGEHTINIHPPTGGSIFVMAVEAWLSTEHPILVTNGGAGGTSTANWTASNVPWAKIPTFDLYQPDLTIVSLGINDAIGGGSASTLEANITTIVTKAKLYGDVLLATMVPSKATTPAGTNVLPNEILYLPKIEAVSTAMACGLVDVFNAFGESGDVAAAAGYMADTYHPNSSGYALFAQTIFDAIPLTENSVPSASFSSSPTGAIEIQFTNSSSDQDGSIASYLWDFGDGATSTSASPKHVYASAGTYGVTLTVTDNRGGQDTVTQQVVVEAPLA